MDCLFCRIARKEIPATVVFEDGEILAFRDIRPQAPVHLLVIPKKHIETLNDAGSEDEALLGRMMLVAKELAGKEGMADNGYRLVMNINKAGGQEVWHIHLHVLGGRQMTWPPG
ncbi:purine nucleoside phosphoramidase [Legionella geestiana]|uniref:Purine nucleoside phosphoramidase n=1 Tax=Legionella geestiana TaxID=45065 RepID=A0A0W0U823_9GAMM|nr:histidine triad nucleotide-binding protein [Legionella geestiana]KTD04072.1 purine nucleoside phosphoramidase [Legionella geestiana]QBS13398.1 histidine triad nucleotide-binding protein [Legionella geestiana]QDQ40307.1 histidine triad nucleotide-binding protein [Legionella geestiana]STX53193.1 purine nucleoside phosphoramidase [Legionella geestiana]